MKVRNVRYLGRKTKAVGFGVELVAGERGVVTLRSSHVRDTEGDLPSCAVYVRPSAGKEAVRHG